jgi:hypothetical protein
MVLPWPCSSARMKDPRLAEMMDPKAMPFDGKREPTPDLVPAKIL